MKRAESRPDRVGIIDIGSNSIKLLVAARNHDGTIAVVEEGIEETRISSGLSRAEPVLPDAGMNAAIEAIGRLQQTAVGTGANRFSVTATSAVRDATNASGFARRLHAATGLDLRILSGQEEAELIAAGVRTDPGLIDLGDFYLFDLGGGSLEALAIQGEDILSMDSLPLGCVRLTEQFVADPEAAFTNPERRRIEAQIESVIKQSAFAFSLPSNDRNEVVITGGTATVALFLGSPDEKEPPGPLTREGIQTHLDLLGALPLAQRRTYPGLPASRADVFPAALTTLLTLLRMGGFATARHSFRNLRYGLAARLLAD